MVDFLTLAHAILETVFPLDCFRCGTRGEYCCTDCLSRIPVQMKSFNLEGMALFSGFAYANPVVRALIHDLKYRQLTSVQPVIEKLIERWALQSGHLLPENCVLVPVPLHASKFRSRGFNQAEIIARMLGELLDIPIASNILIRIRNDLSQTETSNRKKNVTGSFRVCRNLKENIFLIDDVVTSGSTMRACLSALENTDVSCVGGFSFAWGSLSPEDKKTSKNPGY